MYNLIRHHNLKLKSETFKSMINLFVKMKDVSHDTGHLLFLASFEPVFFSCWMKLWFIDRCFQFEGAYNMLTDAEESGEISTVSLYNAIMLGYYREVTSWVPISSICLSWHWDNNVFIHTRECTVALVINHSLHICSVQLISLYMLSQYYVADTPMLWHILALLVQCLSNLSPKHKCITIPVVTHSILWIHKKKVH